ncbi:response regulator [Roseofilum sp. Guam]|uniref:response regulator n=1 Tax=Roseofilum sp. Guam TaxID=2821502 RepID=UPI001B2AA3A0|nr:response regulator [Roseofilum sp. Guam]MBP0031001.1 response regulator [Roseofilum sp. Guam]
MSFSSNLLRSDRNGCLLMERYLRQIYHQQATGELIVTAQDQTWHLFFYLGHLLYATGGMHRSRRWYRYIKLFSVDWSEIELKKPTGMWEYYLLRYALQQHQINLNQAQSVIAYSAIEILFTLLNQPSNDVSSRWKPSQRLSGNTATTPRSSLALKIPPLIQRTQSLSKQWQTMELTSLSPDLAPMLKRELPKRVNAQTSTKLIELFNGENPIWDIALEMKQSLYTLSRSIRHFWKQGIIEFQSLPDLNPPVSWTTPRMDQTLNGESDTSISGPLVACIDDSPLVGHALGHILIPAGYQLLKIHDPISGIAQLAKHKPDLILLDVVMPTVTGYNLCSFLRQTSLFSDTPIIILTSRDHIIDRTKAKLAGATDFLTKPAKPEQLLKLIEKHINPISPVTES